MTSSSRAAQFAAITTQLTPLGGKARGMRLSAEDWNAVVRILSSLVQIDIDQEADTQGRLDTIYARADHQHIGQVTLDWLSPDLQASLGSGGDLLPARQAIAELQRSLAGLRQDVTSLSARVDRQQAAIDSLTAADSDRARQLGGFDERIGGIEDLRVSVAATVAAQNSIKAGVKTVVDLSKRLTDAQGAPIDLSALHKQVADIESAGETRVKTLRADLDQVATRIDQIQTVSGADLNTRLTTLAETLQSTVATSTDKRVDSLFKAFDTNFSQRFTEVEKHIDKVSLASDQAVAGSRELVSAAETRLNASLSGELATTRLTLTATLQQQVGEAVTKSLDGLDQRIATVVTVRTNALRDDLSETFKRSLDTRFDTAFVDTFHLIQTRVSDAEVKLAAATEALPKTIDQRIQAVQAGLGASVDTKLASGMTQLQKSLASDLQTQLRAGLDAGVINAREAAAATVTATLKDLDARIATSVQTATRPLAGQVESIVQAQFAKANVAGQIAAATSAVENKLRVEMAASAAETQKSAFNAINSALVGTRSSATVSATTTLTPEVLAGAFRTRGGS
jgi:hypothetical protein